MMTKRLTQNDRIALGIIKDKKFIHSIKDLHKEMNHLKYGAVNYICHKLGDMGKIILAKYYDRVAGVDKMGIFTDAKTKEEHASKLNSTAVQGSNMTATQLSKLLTKTNLYKLFERVMTPDMDDALETVLERNDLSSDDPEDKQIFLQNVILDIIEQDMGIEVSKVRTLQESNKDAEVYLSNV
jgi:hypothetical protein